MIPASGSGCPAFLRGFPGAVLEISPSGVVLSSNGRLEQELGRALVGRRLVEMLDRASSQEKWNRILAGDGRGERVVWELILREHGALSDPRAFSVVPDPESDSLWLIEHPRDPRLDALSREATEVNSELALTQRELSKERVRLARVLAELELRQQELELRNRDLDQFAYIVSHDLKTPLRGIAGYAYWLERDLKDTVQGEPLDYLLRLRRQVERMERMIDGILRYSRAGRGESAPEVVDVGELLGGVVESLQPPPEARIEVEPGMPELTTSRLQLEQVFQNLIGNALKYADRSDPHVRVGVRDAGEFYEFRVADNGPGIAPALQERVWTIFFTGRPSGPSGATGIGLAIVKKLVENHGGEVWLESEPEQGARFYFQWPKQFRGET